MENSQQIPGENRNDLLNSVQDKTQQKGRAMNRTWILPLFLMGLDAEYFMTFIKFLKLPTRNLNPAILDQNYIIS